MQRPACAWRRRRRPRGSIPCSTGKKATTCNPGRGVAAPDYAHAIERARCAVHRVCARIAWNAYGPGWDMNVLVRCGALLSMLLIPAAIAAPEDVRIYEP